MRASFSLIPMPESRSRTMVYAFQGAPRHSWESHNVILIPMGDFAAGLFDYFYEVNLIGVPLFSSTFSLFPLLPDFSM